MSILVIVLGNGVAHAQVVRTLDVVAAQGDPVVGAPGASFGSQFLAPCTNARGDVAFVGSWTENAETVRGLFVARSNMINRVARDGDAAPGGGVFGSFASVRPVLTDHGTVVFTEGGRAFAADAVGVRLLLAPGLPMPGEPGSTVGGVGRARAARDGSLLLEAGTTSGAFRLVAGVESELAVVVPSVIGLASAQGGLSISSGGAGVAGLTLATRTFVEGVSDGFGTTVARHGDAAPTLPGMTLTGEVAASASSNAVGDVAFLAEVLDPAAPTAHNWHLWVRRDGVTVPVLRKNGPVPGQPGLTVNSMYRAQVAINRNGHVLTHCGVTDGSTTGSVLVLFPFDGPGRVIARSGESVDGVSVLSMGPSPIGNTNAVRAQLLDDGTVLFASGGSHFVVERSGERHAVFPPSAQYRTSRGEQFLGFGIAPMPTPDHGEVFTGDDAGAPRTVSDHARLVVVGGGTVQGQGHRVGVYMMTLPGHCNDVDFNGDGLFPDVADIADLITVISGGTCPSGTCDSIDFNNDGLFPDTLDIQAFLSVFSGGECVQ